MKPDFDIKYFVKKRGRGNFKKTEVFMPYTKNSNNVLVAESNVTFPVAKKNKKTSA